MELYINFDLNKALNTAKLVKKPVQVRGKNGQVFTRMQWVNPADASDGMGIRMINSKQGWENAKKDGIHHHPDYHQALKDQGVHEDTFENHHPHFFLPETEESYNNGVDRLSELEQNHGFGAVVDNGEHEYTYDHEFEPPDHVHKVYNEFHFVPREPQPTDADMDKFLQEHGIHPEVHAVARSIEALDLDSHHDDYSKIEAISQDISLNHWHTLKSHIKDRIKNDLPDGSDPDAKFIRNVQLNAIENGDMRHSLSMAQHPIIARTSVNKILGKDVADKLRDHIKDACLSVNFPGKHKEDIEKGGYKSSQLESYIEKHIGEDGVERLHKILDEHDDFDSQIQALDSLPEMSWSDVVQRAGAEHEAIGLDIEDRKPTYIALNPTNEGRGAATFYGNRWLKVNDDVLKHCTATLDDSFNTSNSFAKIWSMEHLKDIFILKQLRRGTPEYQGTDNNEWALNWGDIPIELQYHKPELKPDQFEIMPEYQDKPFWETEAEDEGEYGDDEDYEDLGDLDLDDDDLEDIFSDDDDLEDVDLEDLDDLDLDDDDTEVDNFKGEKSKNEEEYDYDDDDLPF